MKQSEFKKLKVVEDFTKPTGLVPGDKFLFGKSVVEQLDRKEAGEMITYYVALNVRPDGAISYKAEYSRLEKDMEKEDREWQN